MSNIELLIGQSSTEGERKRRARRALQEQAALPEAVADKCPPYAADICPPERELEIEKEKEIDIELEIKREGEIKPGQTTRAPFGRYKNVFLSEKELAELQTELPGKWEYYIDRLSGYIASSGKKYKKFCTCYNRLIFCILFYYGYFYLLAVILKSSCLLDHWCFLVFVRESNGLCLFV